MRYQYMLITMRQQKQYKYKTRIIWTKIIEDVPHLAMGDRICRHIVRKTKCMDLWVYKLYRNLETCDNIW